MCGLVQENDIICFNFQCHSGVLGGGHYISYNKSQAGKWYCLNDSACKVNKIIPTEVTFYLCFIIKNFKPKVKKIEDSNFAHFF